MSAYPCVGNQPSAMPSAADDGAMSGKRPMRKEFTRPSRPAINGTKRATCRARGLASVLMRMISAWI